MIATMPLELDHIFVFCNADQIATDLDRRGLDVTNGRRHPGQGTANRSVMFSQWYLELIYLSHREEAETNQLRLDRRADWSETGACPFGIGLRTNYPPNQIDQFFRYDPPYEAPFQLWIHRWNDERPELPLVFIMETSKDAPRTVRESHPKAPVHLNTPDATALSELLPASICCRESDEFLLEVELPEIVTGPTAFGPLLRFTNQFESAAG